MGNPYDSEQDILNLESVNIGDVDFSDGERHVRAHANNGVRSALATASLAWNMDEMGGVVTSDFNPLITNNDIWTAGSISLRVIFSEPTEANYLYLDEQGNTGSGVVNSTLFYHDLSREHLYDPSPFFLAWSFNGQPLPGLTVNSPLPSPTPVIGIVSDSDIDSTVDDNQADIPVEIAGAFLTSTTNVPVVDGGYGQTNPIYIDIFGQKITLPAVASINSQAAAVQSDPELIFGYGYTLEDSNRFHTYEIPEALPQGDDQFEIHYQGVSYPLAAGEVFDFTTLDPLGVDSFLLLGIDETELIDFDSPPPFVYGATFMQAGMAAVTTFALVAVPEPSTITLAFATLLLTFGRRRTR